MTPEPEPSVRERARRARAAAAALACVPGATRSAALAAVASALESSADEILEANARDVAAAEAAVAGGRMATALLNRLRLDAAKISALAEGVRQVGAMEDPTGRTTLATELDEGLRLYRVTVPIGVIGVIFESRPDALVQIASLCIKSANAALLKGGREAEHSNRALFTIVRDAAERAGIPAGALELLESRQDVVDLLDASADVDLIVPRGSNEFVRYIQEHTTIPVLGHAEGLCHVYVDAAADLDRAIAIAVDAKTTYPSACNAVETILVHERVAPELLPRLASALAARGVEVRCDERAIALAGPGAVARASASDWATEYCDLVVAVAVVDSLDAAIAHVNRYGSRHTEAIVTEDAAAAERFFSQVDAAGVFWNASTRFADGFRYGFGAEVGISTGKLHPRGPVGLDGLVTYKYRLVGRGHVVADYTGPGARRFTHRPLGEE